MEITKSLKEQQDSYLGSRCALGYAASLLGMDRIGGPISWDQQNWKFSEFATAQLLDFLQRSQDDVWKKDYEYYTETFHALQLITFKYKFGFK